MVMFDASKSKVLVLYVIIKRILKSFPDTCENNTPTNPNGASFSEYMNSAQNADETSMYPPVVLHVER